MSPAYYRDEGLTIPQQSSIIRSDSSDVFSPPITPPTRSGSWYIVDLAQTAQPSGYVVSRAHYPSGVLPSLRRALSDTAVTSTTKLSEAIARTEGLSQPSQEEPYVPGLGRVNNSNRAAAGQSPLKFLGAFADKDIDPDLPDFLLDDNSGLLAAVGGGVALNGPPGSPAFIDKCSQEMTTLLIQISGPQESGSQSSTKPPHAPRERQPNTKGHDDLGHEEGERVIAIPRNSPAIKPSDTLPAVQHDHACGRPAYRPPASPSVNISASGITSSHTRITPFYCTEHDKYFYKRTDLERHFRSPTLHPGTARQYTCPSCRKKIAANVDNLSRHLGTQHGWSAERRQTLISGLRPRGRRTLVNIANTA